MNQLNDNDISVLGYCLPDGTADQYASKAIAVLQQIEKLDVGYLPYLLASDIVLTLSGVRTFDTYIGFEGLHNGAVTALQKVLASQSMTLQSESSEYEAPVDFYYLVNHAALTKIPDQYTAADWVNPNPPYSVDRIHAWCFYIERTLFNLMAEDKLPKAWLADHYSAHDIRFGILLGYPGEAIAGNCWAGSMSEADQSQTPGFMAAIAYHDAYDAAWPTYTVFGSVANNVNVIAHQKLWSDILTKVYESDWHKRLLTSSQFSLVASSTTMHKNPSQAKTV